MKKLSIFILFLFTFSAAFTLTVGQPSAKPRPSRRILFFENFPLFPKPIDQPPEPPAPPRALSDCPAGRKAVPCLFQFASQSGNNNLTPINSTCCALLFNATAECAGDEWPHSFYPQALAYCQHEHPELNPSAPQSSPLPPPSSPPPPPPSSTPPPPPPPSPQAPSGLCDLPANGRTYFQCLLQLNGHDGTRGSPINSTCCGLLLNATEQCPGRNWSEFWPRSIAYCQHPDQNASPKLPPPPPPSPSSLPPPEEAANKCWTFLDTMQSCINEIMTGFFDKRLGMGPACCSAMASWGEDCFSELSRQFPDLFYPSWLRQQCSLPN